MTYPGRNTILRHALVGMQLFDTCPGCDIVLQHTLVRMQFYDTPWSGCSFTTYPGWDTIILYALVVTQITTCPGHDAVL